MTLSTRRQAINFAIYAIENDRILNGLNHDALVGGLMHAIRVVFGGYTFATNELAEIAEVAIQHWDEV